MQRLEFTTPFDFTAASYSGWTRAHWEEAFRRLMVPILASASELGARQLLPGPRSHHGRLADELEGFTRSFIMAGAWMSTAPEAAFELDGKAYDLGAFYRRGILAGTDPKGPEYWGDIVDLAQHLVECASLAWGLHQSRRHVWDRFNPSEQRQVADYLFQCTRVKYHQNNWLLFNVVTNAVLKSLGMPYSQEQIDRNLEACDGMYLGEGWYRDGDVNRIDYYNAWAFHYYYLIWCVLDGDSKPELARKHAQRVREFARDFRYFFAADGAAPCFGRSMIYRFGYLAPLALARHLKCLDISDGELRTMMDLGVKFFLTQDVLTDAGHLSMGYLRPNASMLEHYSCGGSPYWAVKAFNVLMLPPEDPFWAAPEAPLPIHQGDYCKPLKQAGLLVVGTRQSGHVQIVNQKSRHDNAEYNDKYTNFAYSSVFSYESGRVYKNINCDSALQFSSDGIHFGQRWKMDTLHLERGFAESRYALHLADEQGQAHTAILVKDDFLIQFHRVDSRLPLWLREGSYALGFDEGSPVLRSGPDSEAAFLDGRMVYLRNLHGWDRHHPAAGYGDQVNGTNVRHRRSVMPLVTARTEGKPRCFATLTLGRVGPDTFGQLEGLVDRVRVEGNRLTLRFYDGEEAFVQVGPVEPVGLKLGSRRLEGDIKAARVTAAGAAWILREDGTLLD